jgi:hypothetical protein
VISSSTIVSTTAASASSSGGAVTGSTANAVRSACGVETGVLDAGLGVQVAVPALPDPGPLDPDLPGGQDLGVPEVLAGDLIGQHGPVEGVNGRGR